MDHISIPIADTTATRTFYAACLEPLGWRLRGNRDGRYVGFDKPGSPVLYFGVAEARSSVHLAFVASDEKAVRAFLKRRWPTAGGTTDRPGRGRATAPATSRRSSSTPMGTTSRRSSAACIEPRRRPRRSPETNVCISLHISQWVVRLDCTVTR